MVADFHQRKSSSRLSHGTVRPPAQLPASNPAAPRCGAAGKPAGQCAGGVGARDGRRRGASIVARMHRWRGLSGEIDVIARDGDAVVFIEVKQSKTHALAVEHLCERQMQRICRAASEYLGGEPDGLNTSSRFDVALVDAQGRIEILPNAFAA